ncbi:MAG: serine acetyltransferase [Candidatus Krumholzibacteria bacterium]|nr:serine acetyltransferase [Candidatus Krumholzibacteria bacterium]
MEGYPDSSQTVYRALRSARACFHAWLFRVSSEREIIGKDIDRWTEVLGGGRGSLAAPKGGLVRLIARYPEFRTLFHYRVAKERRLGIKVLLELAKRCYRPLESLYIETPSIGPGLFIQHGFSTIIAAKSLGENCWVNQQVTIGFSSVDDCPTLGNNVSIKAGAIVIGDIMIGDGAVVGAGAVVVKDVPPGSTAIGVPARIIDRGAAKTAE